MSLDGYLAGPNGEADWIVMDPDVDFKAMSDQFDTMLVGGNTYRMLTGGKKPKSSKGLGMRAYVFSRTLTAVPDGVELVREDAAGFVTRLKEQEGKDICLMGGGDLARTFFEAGLIDEIGFNIHPVLLGRGIPLFHGMDRQINLELTECRRFRNGCVYVTYRVNNDG